MSLDGVVTDLKGLQHELVDLHVLLKGFIEVSSSDQVAQLPQDVVEVVPG